MQVDTLAELKRKSWKFYKQWRNEVTLCPVFKEVILVSLLGWNHVIGNDQHKRTGMDVYRRLALLSFAKGIITRSTTFQNIKIRNGITYFALEAIVTIGFDYHKVRVVILEDWRKRKTFLSVMGKKLGVPHA